MSGKKCLLIRPFIKADILKEILWNNRFIKIDGLSVYDKKLHEAGIKKIEDLLDVDNEFLSHTKLCRKYKIDCNVLTYYSLIHAMPQAWKILIHTKTENVSSHRANANIDFHKVTTKAARKILSEKSFTRSTAERRLKERGFSDVDIQNIYILPFRITISHKLQQFQFKINHSISYQHVQP